MKGKGSLFISDDNLIRIKTNKTFIKYFQLNNGKKYKISSFCHNYFYKFINFYLEKYYFSTPSFKINDVGKK